MNKLIGMLLCAISMNVVASEVVWNSLTIYDMGPSYSAYLSNEQAANIEFHAESVGAGVRLSAVKWNYAEICNAWMLTEVGVLVDETFVKDAKIVDEDKVMKAGASGIVGIRINWGKLSPSIEVYKLLNHFNDNMTFSKAYISKIKGQYSLYTELFASEVDEVEGVKVILNYVGYTADEDNYQYLKPLLVLVRE